MEPSVGHAQHSLEHLGLKIRLLFSDAAATLFLRRRYFGDVKMFYAASTCGFSAKKICQNPVTDTSNFAPPLHKTTYAAYGLSRSSDLIDINMHGKGRKIFSVVPKSVKLHCFALTNIQRQRIWALGFAASELQRLRGEGGSSALFQV